MASALQQQLAAIAATSTHQLDLQAQKGRHSQSLLFEARDAATQTFDTIYQLCLEGFEELCQLDVRFVAFAHSLFSEQSKSEDRTQMTTHENTRLDAVIVRFLGLLGARLLLKPAMKAAEWLVRRFRVHEYNTDAVLMTFLPYHSSNIFAALLSILPNHLPPNFRFLQPYVTSLQCPPRHAIVTAASKNAALATAFSYYVLDVAKARHHSALLLGFWASITAQVVNGMIDASRSGRDTIRRQREEDLLLKVLPILQIALSIEGVPELYLGSCMIVTILASKVSLSDKALNAIMEAVADNWTSQTIEDGIICLAVLAEEKEGALLPLSVLSSLLKHDDTLAAISRVGAKCRVEGLMLAASRRILIGVSQKQVSQAFRFLTRLLETTTLSENGKIELLKDILTQAKSDHGAKANGNFLGVLNSLARQDQRSQLIGIASQKVDVDVATLDPNLFLQLEAGAMEENADEPEGIDLDEEPSTTEVQPKIAFDDLPTLNNAFSFLGPDEDEHFSLYSTAFRQAVRFSDTLPAFLALLGKDSCMTKPTVCTFLARVWTSSTSRASRVRALQITSDLLLEAQKDKRPIDMQILLPYLATALSDSYKSVRSAAASVCIAFSDFNKLNKNPKSANESYVWAKTNVYGNDSSKVYLLPSLDCNRLVTDTIVPVLEDCVIDSNHITTTLADAINGSSTQSQNDKKELKSVSRTAIYAYLVSHLTLTPVDSVKLRLLAILSKVGKAAGTVRTQALLQYVRTYIGNVAIETEPPINMKLCKALLGSLTHRSTEEIQFVKDTASGSVGGTATSKLAFNRIRQLWLTLGESSQADILDWLLSLTLSKDVSEDIQSNAIETLRNLSMNSVALVHLIEDLPSAAELQGQPTPAKKQRTSRTSETPRPGSVDKEKLNTALRRITVVLELVEGCKPERHPQLLRGLFHLLSELHHYKTLLDSELVYLQGLLINSLLSIVNGLEAFSKHHVDRSAIRPDLIVDCVRTTSSTQVHQSALLLMSALASWAPDLVLHSVMPLFTFMSSTILKQGDDYSAHVTDQTVARIIPPLAASLKRKGKDLITGAAELLLSFTAAFEHIPLHRRSDLFKHLVQTLGPSESLFAIVAMLVERYSVDSSVRPFVANLMNAFPVAIELCAVQQYLELVFDSLKPKRGLSDIILGFGEKSKEQAADATNTLLDGLADIISRDVLRKKLARDLKPDDGRAETLRVTYSVVLEKTMQLGLQLKDSPSLHRGAANVLNSLLSLMPTKDFIDSSAKLMQTGSDEIRQQVFQSLEQRVITAKRGDAALQRVFVEVLPNCAIFLVESQPVATRLAAITCIDRIAEKFGKTDRAAVMQAAEQVAGIAAMGSTDDSLRRMSLLCLASMIEVLEDEFIPILSKTLEHALSSMQETLDAEEADEDLLSACFSFSMAILDHVPWMLSGPYLDRLLVLAADADSEGARQFNDLAARKIAAQDILVSIDRTWKSVGELGADAAEFHLLTLRKVVQHHPRSVITKNAQVLFSTLLHAFDLRRVLHNDQDGGGDNSALFRLVNDSTMDAVLKLNDAMFRPFFIRLVDWASTSLPRQDKAGRIFRQLSLYSFTLTLFDQLKSLVTTYVSYVLDNAASLLTADYKSGDDALELINLVVMALSSNFSHDQDGFWQSPAHFDLVAEPTINLIRKANTIDVIAAVIPAIVELASAANSPDHHKAIDDALLAFMRHDDAAVRLAAVKAERALTERLSFDWCNFIPAWLPFIAELQEDDDGAVERETLRWMAQIEEVTGESVNDMLR